MNPSEMKVRDALDRGVGVPPLRSMPPGTRSRVRGRQARWVAGLTVVAVAVTLAGIGTLRIAASGGNGPASGNDIVRDHPLEFVPQGWPAVDVGDPADGYTMPPDAAGSDGPVRVIASGTVDGEGFSFQSFVGAGPDADLRGPCLGFAGPGLDEFASPDPQPPGAVGGISSATCAHPQGVPARTDLYLAGQRSPQAPGIAAHYGFLGPRVTRLELRLDDGATVDVPLLGSPPGWDGIQAFLFFPPEGSRGTLTALAEDGTPLAEARTCYTVYSDTASGGCGGPTTQLTPVPAPS